MIPVGGKLDDAKYCTSGSNTHTQHLAVGTWAWDSSEDRGERVRVNGL